MKQHPAMIAFDVQFSEKSFANGRPDIHDQVPFVNAISDAHGRIVFSSTEPEVNGDSHFLGVSANMLIYKDGLKTRIGFGGFHEQADGVIRTQLHTVSHLVTLAVATAGVATGKPVPTSQFADRDVYIDFRGPAMTFPYISYWKVLDGKVPPGYFRNKIVIVGATASNLQYIHATSTDNFIPGPEIQASAIETILRGLPLIGAPGWLNIMLIVLLGITVPAISLRLGPVAATGVAFGLAAVFTVGNQLAFNSGLVVAYVDHCWRSSSARRARWPCSCSPRRSSASGPATCSAGSSPRTSHHELGLADRGDDQGPPHQLLMAESTKEALRSPHAELVFFDELPIRGRVEPVKLWSVAEGVAAVTVQPVKASSTEGAE